MLDSVITPVLQTRRMETVCSFLVYLIKQQRREQRSNCVADQGSPSRDYKDFELLSITYIYHLTHAQARGQLHSVGRISHCSALLGIIQHHWS